MTAPTRLDTRRKASADMLPALQVLPTALQVLPTTGDACGTSCGSSCGSSIGSRRPDHEEPGVQIPFAKRRLKLSAVPTRGTSVAHIDMDLTVECNLRCTYCFKEKWNEHMEEQVAFDTIIWLLHASGQHREVGVNFMGGEPLIRFRLIKKLVPFAKRRGAEMGKRVHFGMTTNGTLVTDEVVEFWKQWGLGFHTSIDGTPEVQDRNRPTTGGRGSSRLVEQAVPKILNYRPNTTARSTVTPEGAGEVYESYLYFRSLGYTNIAFVPGGQPEWDEHAINLFENQFRLVGDDFIQEMRQGRALNIKGIEDYIDGQVRNGRHTHACGAGRGLVLVDIHGDIWPCHRWNKERQASWRIGSIYEQFDDAARAILDQPDHTVLLEQDCPRCPAQNFCSGGCPAENLEQTGSVYRRHSNACELTRVWARVGRHVYDTLFGEKDPTFMSRYYPKA